MARTSVLTAVALLLVAFVAADVYFEETFEDGDGYKARWVESKWKGKDQGPFELSAGTYNGDTELDKGLKTMEDYRWYDISAKFPTPLETNKDKTLVIQYTVKHEQKLDCGGGYLKVFGSDLNQEEMGGESEYKIMFGPDICGTSTKKTHVIFTYKGKNLLTKKDIKCETDELTHIYTLVLRPDNTYEVFVDWKSVEKGDLYEDFDFLEPKKIRDPESIKPKDWVDEAEIDDPEDKKPDGYDDIPKQIADPDAKQPEDWDEDSDGTWEAPMIDNPEYKGPWKAKKIPNPAYKGKWEPNMIPNPAFVDDKEVYVLGEIGAIGVEVWQVKAGSIFDNILVTDSEEIAKARSEPIMERMKTEKTLKTRADEDARKAAEEERKKREAEEAAKKKDEPEEDDDDDEDDEPAKKEDL